MSHLWHCLVVDVDEFSWLRVDLEGLVEAEGGIDGVGAWRDGWLVWVAESRHVCIGDGFPLLLHVAGRGLTILAHLLSSCDFGHEVLLSLFRVLGEALIVGLVDGAADALLLALLCGDGLLLGGA